MSWARTLKPIAINEKSNEIESDIERISGMVFTLLSSSNIIEGGVRVNDETNFVINVDNGNQLKLLKSSFMVLENENCKYSIKEILKALITFLVWRTAPARGDGRKLPSCECGNRSVV